eukprot:gene4904-5148_t
MIDVIAAHRPPLVFVEAGASEKPLFKGFLVDLLPTLMQTAGIQEPYTIRAFNGGGGSLLSNGSWSGVMGQLTTGQADLALFPLTLTARRAKYIQHTTPFMDDGYAILVQVNQQDPDYSFLLPFSAQTWACFLSAMAAIVLILSILDLVTRRARLKAVERTYGVLKSQKTRRRDKVMHHAIETIMMTVGSGAAPTSRSWAVKVMFIAWAIFSVIMLAAYTANLTANLTVNQIGVTIKGLSDLAATSLPFGVPADSSVSVYFKNSSDRGAVAIHRKMVEYKSTEDGARAVRDKKIAAFICDYPVAQYFTQEPPCVLALGTETLGSGSLVMGLPPNSTLTDRLNTALLQLGEAGYLSGILCHPVYPCFAPLDASLPPPSPSIPEELRRKWFVEASQCADQPDSGTSKNGRLSMTQAWSVFMVLAVGAGVAIVIGLLEVLYYRKLYTGVHKLKSDVSMHGTLPALRKHLKSSKIRSHKFSAASGEKPLFTGFLIDLLPALLQTAGIEEPYAIRHFNGSGGSQLSNGSWSGVMGQLTTGQADLALFPLTLTARRAPYIQHTAAYMDEGYGMLVRVKEVDPGYSFLMPFSTKTWLCFLAAMLTVVLLLTMLDIITRNARLKAIERTQGIIYSQRTRQRDKVMHHAIETIMMSVGSGAAPTSRSWAVKVMFIAWAIFSVIMLAAYTANLTANLTVNQIEAADAPGQKE